MSVCQDGKILTIYKRDGISVTCEVQTVRSAQMNMDIKHLHPIDKHLLQLMLVFIPTINQNLLRLIVEYSAEGECRQLMGKNHLVAPVCRDMNIELIDAIKIFHESLENDIPKLSKNKFRLFFEGELGLLSDSFENKVKLKLALEFFVSLLNSDKSFSECLKEAISSSFSKEIIILGKKLPALGVEIAKVMPKPEIKKLEMKKTSI